ncbi:NCOA1 protein, partial [Tichodroma muraria]|nr:NCOA1 protein [Tichodroma muraria]
PAGCNSVPEFPGMPQQSDAAFAPALSPGSPLMSPQVPAAAAFQAPELKSWQAAALGNNGYGSRRKEGPRPPGDRPGHSAVGIGRGRDPLESPPLGSPHWRSPSQAPSGARSGGRSVPCQGAGIAAERGRCSRQVPDAALRPPGLYCSQLGSGELLKAEADGAQ